MRGPMLIPTFDGISQSHTPGKCFQCGTSDPKRRVICTGQWIGQTGVPNPPPGKIQYCDECIKAYSRLIGMIDPERADDLAVSARDANLAKGALTKRIAKLEAAIAALKALSE